MTQAVLNAVQVLDQQIAAARVNTGVALRIIQQGLHVGQGARIDRATFAGPACTFAALQTATFQDTPLMPFALSAPAGNIQVSKRNSGTFRLSLRVNQYP